MNVKNEEKRSGVVHHIIFHLRESFFIPFFLHKVTIDSVKTIHIIIIKILIDSRKIEESLGDCVVDFDLSHLSGVLHVAKIPRIEGQWGEWWTVQ